MIYHLQDHSALWGTTTDPYFGTSGTGWSGFATTAGNIMTTFGVGLAIRQVFPTASNNPLHFDGWVQNGEGIWQTDFITEMDSLYDINSIPHIFYVGHASGDTGVTAYAPSPTLSSGGEELSEAAYDTAFDAAAYPYITAGRGKSHIFVDGSSALGASTQAYRKLCELQDNRRSVGAMVGVESPYNLEDAWSHLHRFHIGAAFGSFQNRLWNNASNDWRGYRKPAIVFTNHEPPAWTNTGETLGGVDTGQLMLLLDRTIIELKYHGWSLMSLSPAYNAGFTSLTEYFAYFGREYPIP